ncbi:cytoplasmic FMR1-interacting protein 1-like [Convolutriloba macropyga]|uniref:cytoplasmic FMR1-interacting protein 1-like n=1 Tax=Convolutriloba macropyga TaxID=536237 RepID=UPI003F52071B
MEPEIRKAFQLYKYHQESAKFLAGEIYKFSQSLVKGDDSRPGANKNFYSETCLVTMGKMLGSFVALDNLICFNAAFRNDFAEYNRTLIKAKNAGVAPNNIEEDQKLGEMKMFFAQKTPLQDALFKYLQELDQQAGVASGLIINFFKKLILTCADNFGKGKFVMPSEKEDYLKIISCCLKFIMRSEKKFESNNQIFSKCFKDEEKKQIIKCFKSISVLKDFGDVPIDENQLLVDMTGKGSDKQNSLHDRLQEFEREHGAIVCRIMDLVRNYNLMTERAMRLQADEVFENYMDNVARQWYELLTLPFQYIKK